MRAAIEIILRTRFLYAISVLGLVCSLSSANAETSVSQFGIKWFFSEDRPVGQFANGDFWVVGPVTITRITPDTINDQNGTMINPAIGKSNGWDSRIRYSQYSSSLNVAKSLPRTVTAGSSVVSAISFPASVAGDNPQMETIAVLTVLGATPATGSFRPPYQGTDKSLRWNASQLNFGALRRLAPVAGTPSLSVVEGYFERPWIEKETTWVGRYFHPHLNHPFQNRPGAGTYGREMAHTAADGLLSLQLNYTDAQKTKLAVRLVQSGIDIYGAARLGAAWIGDGGHNQGRKMVMLLAGAMLGDADILRLADASRHKIFQEDTQCFYVTAADVALSHVGINDAAVENYVAGDIGMPEWGAKHVSQPEFDNKRWDAPYRSTVGPCAAGHILTGRLMNLESKWNHPATFDYWDRWYSIEGNKISTATNNIQPFVANMWKAYRGTSITPPPSANFKLNDRISTIRNTNVRASGTLSGTLLGVQITGSLGTIAEEPSVIKDGITWWRVNYDSGADGWSGEDNFAKSTVGPPGPTPPLAPSGVGVTGLD